jgi:predicted phage-related endonuclease
MLVHPDGIVEGSRPRLYEGKTARSARDRDGNVVWGEPGTDEIPEEYVLQVQHGMLVVAARFDITIEVADVAVLIGLDDYRQYEVPADRELQEMLVDEERDFWRRVQSGDAPPITTPNDVKLKYGRASVTGVVHANDEIAAAVAELAALKDRGARDKPRIESLEAKIQLAFGDLDTLVHRGKVLATWRAQKGRKGFDDEALAKAHPTLNLNPFRTTGDPFRRLLIKVKPQETSNVSTAQ